MKDTRLGQHATGSMNSLSYKRSPCGSTCGPSCGPSIPTRIIIYTYLWSSPDATCPVIWLHLSVNSVVVISRPRRPSPRVPSIHPIHWIIEHAPLNEISSRQANDIVHRYLTISRALYTTLHYMLMELEALVFWNNSIHCMNIQEVRVLHLNCRFVRWEVRGRRQRSWELLRDVERWWEAAIAIIVVSQ